MSIGFCFGIFYQPFVSRYNPLREYASLITTPFIFKILPTVEWWHPYLSDSATIDIPRLYLIATSALSAGVRYTGLWVIARTIFTSSPKGHSSLHSGKKIVLLRSDMAERCNTAVRTLFEFSVDRCTKSWKPANAWYDSVCRFFVSRCGSVSVLPFLLVFY